MLPSSFDFHPRTRIVYGPNKIDLLGHLAQEIGAHRALVVSDPGIVAAGHTERGIHSLEAAGIECALFEGVVENPTTIEVEAGVEAARALQADLLIGLGGGSSLDCAKGINFIYSNGGRMEDYWGEGKASKPMLPMIAVPTTAGTGSEAQSFAIISDPQTRAKMACGDKKAACCIALLDPVLTLTQPVDVATVTGIDAISHALESYVSTRRSSMSLLYSREAWRLLANNYAQVIDNPDDLDARGGMQLGSCLAGLAIENSMLGAAHALSNPLTACYNITHGRAIALMLPHVLRFNAEKVETCYSDLAREIPQVESNLPPTPSTLVDFVTKLIEKGGFTTNLRGYGIEMENLPDLADSATKQWTGSFNPRPASRDDFLALYQAAF